MICKREGTMNEGLEQVVKEISNLNLSELEELYFKVQEKILKIKKTVHKVKQ